jgi:YD repeat-containing protein
MKTFRAIGMAMLAVLLCVGNSSCSKEDDLGGNGDVTSGSKKLTKIVQTYESGDSEEVIFSYDDNGRLISCYDENGNIHQYSWSDNTITRTKGDDVRTYSYVDGLIRQEQRKYYTLDYAYNSSKQIIALNWFDKYSNMVDPKETYSWENGRITQIIHEEHNIKHKTQITYGSTTCKGHNPFMTMTMSNSQLFWVHPELIGVTYKQLPIKIVTDSRVKDISYTLDKDGYVIGCFVEQITKTNGEESKITYTYTFTWE